MQSVAAVWTNLRDPRDERAPDGARCDVIVTRQAWKHVLERHVRTNDGPWCEWFPKRSTRLLQDPGGDAPARAAASLEVLEAVGHDVRVCLERPLAMLCESFSAESRCNAWRAVWHLVLPHGAMAILAGRGNPHLVTCYYLRATARCRNSEQRWRRTVATLVARCTRPHPQGLVPPDAAAVVPFRSTRVIRGVRFVTLQHWGFATDLAGTPWRGRLEPWNEPITPVSAIRRRLKPRRGREDADHER